MTVMFCPYDQRNIDTEHSWNLTVLIVLLIFLTLIGIIYMAVKWNRRCPLCKTPAERLLPASGIVGAPAPGYAQGAPMAPPAMAVQSHPCTTCGYPLAWNGQYNRWFCPTENKWI